MQLIFLEIVEAFDYLVSSQPPPDVQGYVNVPPMPEPLSIPLELGYDLTLSIKYGSDEEAAKFIKQVVGMAFPFFQLKESKQPKINWITTNKIQSFSNFSITADQMCKKNPDAIGKNFNIKKRK